ncbi:hypothetical protein [Nocardia gipuzkoensis]|uniref:hypothetical protein n=1 Tax=Nocardia gipuzkoensis TaxID=2749991 RepID=UPI00237DA959|nr:hypothetical protein [Nocardia gipuzkoensis]MDE1674323.1 hypothetical protein [Nocardia gipuzkoensis]
MNHGHQPLRADLTEGQLLTPPASSRNPAPARLDKRAKTPTVIDTDDGEDVVLVITLICDHTQA